MPKTRLAVLTLALGAMAACGTTVPLANQTASQQGLSDGTGAVDGSSSTAADAGAGSPTGGPAVAVGGPGSVSDPSTSQPGSDSNGPSSSVNGPGQVVTSSKISVGIPYADAGQSSALLGSIGGGLAPGDSKAVYDLLFADLNKHGGIRGHQVVPDFYKIDLTSTIPEQERAACQDFTVDHKVLVAFGDASPGFARCVLKGGAAVVHSFFNENLASEYANLPYVYQPSGIPIDRLMSLYGKVLGEMSFFKATTPVKVGVLYEDTPAYRKAEKVLEQTLALQGIKVEVTQAFAPVASEGDIGSVESQVQSSVLRFRSRGVTHVLGVETNAWLIGFFGVGAAQQGYYPRYAYDSNEFPNNVVTNVPAKGLHDSLVFGYVPGMDVLDAKQFTPTGKACLKFLASKGYQTPNTGNGLTGSFQACDNVGMLKAALLAAPADAPISRTTFDAGVRRLGRTFASAETFSTSFSTGFGYQAAVSAYKRGRFDDGCGCFVYTSGLLPLR